MAEQIIASYIVNDDNNGFYIEANVDRKLAQIFAPIVTADLTKIRVKVHRANTHGIVSWAIKRVDGDIKPVDEDIATGSMDADLITTSTSGSWYYVDMSSVQLDLGTVYGLVLHAPNEEAGDKITWRADWGIIGYGYILGAANDGTTWTMFADKAAMFEVHGTPAGVAGGQGGPAALLVAQGVI